MDTLIKSNPVTASAHSETTKTSAALSGFLNDLETHRFAVAPMLLVVIACLGGVAAAYAAQENELKLMSVAVSASFVEILIIALAPMRLVLASSIVALIIDLMVFIF